MSFTFHLKTFSLLPLSADIAECARVLSVLTQTTVSADTDNQPEGGKKVDKLYKIHIAAPFLNQGVKGFLCFFELSYML